MSDNFTDMERRYRENSLPWNVTLPPPEVLEMTEQLAPGRLLDLGCGVGRASIYMARHGWRCDGIDFIPQAIEMAQAQARAAGLAEQINFYNRSVAELDFLEPFYDFGLDVGCLHSQPPPVQTLYVRSLARLLRPAGHYLLFSRLKMEGQAEQKWLTEQIIVDLFETDFIINRYQAGTSPFGEVVAPSAWVWMQRKSRDLFV